MGQYIPLASFLHGLDARSKIIITVLLSVAVFGANSYMGLIPVFAVIIILIALSKIKLLYYIKGLKPFVWIIMIIAAASVVFRVALPLLHVYPLNTSLGGAQAGFILIIKIIAVILLFQLLSKTTTPVAMTDGIARLFRPLEKVGFPVHDLVMIMTLSLRFIPLMAEEAERIRKAQVSRGAHYSGEGSRGLLKKWLAIVVPLFRLSFMRAAVLAEAMESRGYQGGKNRSSLYRAELQAADYLVVLAAGTLLWISHIL